MFRFAMCFREGAPVPALAQFAIEEDGDFARQRVAKCLLKHGGHDAYCSGHSWTCTDSECMEIMDEVCYRWDGYEPRSTEEAIRRVSDVFGLPPCRVWLGEREHRVVQAADGVAA